MKFRLALPLIAGLLIATPPNVVHAQDGPQLKLTKQMLVNESDVGQPEQFIDEQDFTGPYVALQPETTLEFNGVKGDEYPVHFYLDFGEVKHLSQIAVYDLNGRGDLIFSTGEPGNWTPVYTEDGVGYKTWKPAEFLHSTQYLRVTKADNAAVFGEMLLWEQTAEERQAMQRRDAALAKAEDEAANRKQIDAGDPFGKLTLIHEINVGDPTEPGGFAESREGDSKTTQILGQTMRVLEPGDEAKYFAYRLGQYKLLEAGKPYLLTVDFPEDTARAFAIANRGGEFSQGVYTGSSVGDVFFTYTNNNLESLDIPLSGEMETYRQLFYLSERTEGVEVSRGGGERPLEPEDGFWVVFSIPNAKNMLGSEGAAVSRIRLFEVDDVARYDLKLSLPPEGLPRRHVFVREEMGDGAINSTKVTERAYEDPVQFYRNKASLYRFLGMDTMCKDLLEFGATQGWDTGNSDWFTAHKFPHLWEGIVEAAAEKGLNVLPYYEYAGSKGKLGLGMEQRAEPLKGKGDYTHVAWTEKARADLTDPDTLTDLLKVMELTIIRHKDKANFLGAWFRPRVSQLPISFADATRERFGQQANNGQTPSRRELADNEQLRERYYEWWFGKRKEFLVAVRDYLQSNGVEDASIIYTTVSGETGPSIWDPGWGNTSALVTDQPDMWQGMLTGEDYEKLRVVPFKDAANNARYSEIAQRFPRTWGGWEWDHGAPPSDPGRYEDVKDIYMSYPFNRLYSVAEGSGMEQFETQQGMAAVRFYPLNENTRDKLIGYFVADYERAGPYCMLEEANAVAHGDVRFMGFLSGYSLNSGFPQQVRRFNANFLALPALPSRKLASAADQSDVVVRQIDSPGHGTWFAVVNTGYQTLSQVQLDLGANAAVTDAVTGESLSDSGQLSISLDPGELRALHTADGGSADVSEPN